jgi:hypothetical protein
VLEWLSRRVVRAPNGRGSPASFWWFCGHAAALIVLVCMTLIRGDNGALFWIIGLPLSLSCYVGQYVIQRRANRAGPS